MERKPIIFLLLFFPTMFARAAIVPPPGFDSWIWHGATYCSSPSASGVAECGGSATGSLAVIDRAHPDHGVSTKHIGGGTVSANQMTQYYESNRSFQKLFTSVRDVYTLTGPPGEIDLTVRLSGEAEASRVIAFGSTTPIGQLRFGLSIGTNLGDDGRSLTGAFAFADDQLPSGVGPLSKLLAAEAVGVRTVTVNQPFSLAFRMILEGTSGSRGDARNTAVIGFDIPDGYALTSELGWTPVPLPPALPLLAAGLLSLCRRRAVIAR